MKNHFGPAFRVSGYNIISIRFVLKVLLPSFLTGVAVFGIEGFRLSFEINVEQCSSLNMSDILERYLVIENEDDLTRIVFGLLDLLGPSVLTDVLELPPEMLSNEATIKFHERIDPRAERVPDVVIEDADTTVLIEAKRGTTADPDQLRDEHEDLRRYGNGQKHLILISGHESRPGKLDDLDLEYLDWLSWGDIAARITNVDHSELTETQTQLIVLLQTTLEEEGYLPFTGFSEELLDDMPKIWDLFGDYRKQIARFHREIEGLLADRGLQAKNMWRNGISQDFNRFPTELPFAATHVWIAYGESDCTINSKYQHYLFVAFCIEHAETPLVRVGYSLSPKQSPETRTVISDNADAIVDFVASTESQLLHTDRNFHIIERFDDAEGMTALLNAPDTLKDVDRVQIATEYGVEQLVQDAVTTHVANELIELHEFAYPSLHP